MHKYHCVLFPLTGESIEKMLSDAMYSKFLAKSVFTAFNVSMYIHMYADIDIYVYIYTYMCKSQKTNVRI